MFDYLNINLKQFDINICHQMLMSNFYRALSHTRDKVLKLFKGLSEMSDGVLNVFRGLSEMSDRVLKLFREYFKIADCNIADYSPL